MVLKILKDGSIEFEAETDIEKFLLSTLSTLEPYISRYGNGAGGEGPQHLTISFRQKETKKNV